MVVVNLLYERGVELVMVNISKGFKNVQAPHTNILSPQITVLTRKYNYFERIKEYTCR